MSKTINKLSPEIQPSNVRTGLWTRERTYLPLGGDVLDCGQDRLLGFVRLSTLRPGIGNTTRCASFVASACA